MTISSGAGFASEIVEDEDSRMNMWANTSAAGEVKPAERYVIKVPRKQAETASRV